MQTKISPASIYVNENSTPTSLQYDDVYFHLANGAKETDYVFIQGNDLVNKWEHHQNNHFCIAETGFGTGLNFFRSAQHFQLFRQRHPNHPLTTLIFISTEKHPLDKNDAEKILHQWEKDDFLGNISDTTANASIEDFTLPQDWLKQYPDPIAGIHRRHFSVNSQEGKAQIILDLHYGDATDCFAQIEKKSSGVVDAWFLDGFAPSKNNSMWTQALYEQMASLSKANCSFATFTAASAVKRGLSNAGFNVSKRKGFKHKREMLMGYYSNEARQQIDPQTDNQTPDGLTSAPVQNSTSSFQQAPYFTRSALHLSDNNAEITIIGSGLAGAIMALKLTQRGKRVNLLWQAKMPSDGASGNPIGGFYPQLNAQHNAASQIQLHSFLYASEFYTSLNTSQAFSHDWCGALQIAFNENTKTRLDKVDKANLWPREIAHLVDAAQAAKLANIPMPYSCLYIPKAGWIEPPSVVEACLELAQKSGLLTIQNNIQLLDYTCLDDGDIQLQLTNNNKNNKNTATTYVHQTQALVLAMGSGSKPLTKHVIPLRFTRGQVEMVAVSNSTKNSHVLPQLSTLLCHKGYFTPAVHGFHALGSSYIKNDMRCDVREAETVANFAMHINSINNSDWQQELEQARLNPNNYARAAIRCSSPDHLPIVGAMPKESQFTELADLYKALPLHRYPVPSDEKNVFILTGLGSRGLTTAPLMAQILLSQMLQEPLPLAKSLLDALNPNRFLVRSLIRREAWKV